MILHGLEACFPLLQLNFYLAFLKAVFLLMMNFFKGLSFWYQHRSQGTKIKVSFPSSECTCFSTCDVMMSCKYFAEFQAVCIWKLSELSRHKNWRIENGYKLKYLEAAKSNKTNCIQAKKMMSTELQLVNKHSWTWCGGRTRQITTQSQPRE